ALRVHRNRPDRCHPQAGNPVVVEPNLSYNLPKLRSLKKAGPPAFFIAFLQATVAQKRSAE
ncbi:MAG TPA: hypothetical protein VE421_07340, partial [Burkholderiaceae bacterium]|nr:hypothetical protein [Burkholderiaceae bacterium]